jgi:hypothetical protein
MRHIKKPVWEKRIPTVFALVLVAGSIFLTGQFLQQRTSTTGRASQTATNSTIEIGNITDSSFTVSFTTPRPTVAGIKVSGPNMVDSVFFGTTSQESLVTHSILIPNLKPQTQYSFTVLLEGETIQDGTKQFSVITAPVLEPNDSVSTASGAVVNTDGSFASDVLMVISNNTSQTLTTTTDSNGRYSFNLANLRTNDLKNYATFTKDSLFTLKAYFKDQSSYIEIPYSNLKNIPSVTLSQNYTFDFQEELINSTSGAELSIPRPSTQTSYTLSVSAPREGQSLIDDRPVIRGTSAPRTTVVIRINNKITESTLSDTFGRWEIRPVNPLPQGENTLVIQSKDALGVQKSITRSMSVFPSGMQVVQSATPSATLTITPTSTRTPSPTATATIVPTISTTPNPTSTITATPTATLTIAPTVIPTNTLAPTKPPFITITPTPPGSLTTAVITVASVILIVTGSILLFILG